MKKLPSLFCVVCIVLTAIWVLPVLGEYENNQDDDFKPIGSRSILFVGPGQTYSKIQDAINASKAGDTIRVYAGTYFENVIMNKTLNLIGNNSANTIINASYTGNGITIKSNWTNVSGFRIVAADIFPWDSGEGISLDNVGFCTISNINFTDNRIGIGLQSSNNNNIIGCEGSSNKLDFINLTFSNDNYISDCKGLWNPTGMVIIHSHRNVFVNNSFRFNSMGIRVIESGNNSFSNNILWKNYYDGISLEGLDCSYNSIYLNNFIGNNKGGTQASDGWLFNKWNTTNKGNYWDNWTSPDSNKDGIVDLPYDIGGPIGAKDYFPLVNPTKIVSAPPKITTTNIFPAYVGVHYSNQYSAIDADTPTSELIWNIQTNASWLNFGTIKLLNGTPTISDIGKYWVNISVSDEIYMDSTNFMITVLKQQPSTGRVFIVRTGQSYPKIQDAIDNAIAGDTIRAYAGFYYENIVIDKTLNLIGNGSQNTTIAGGNPNNVVTINANGCNISGFKFDNGSDVASNANIGIFVNSNNNSFSDLNCSYNKYYGIYLNYSDNNVIKNSIFYSNSGSGINLSWSNYNHIENCTFANNGQGVSFLGSNNNFMEYNTFISNRNGIHMFNSNNNKFSYNIFRFQKYSAFSIYLGSSSNLVVFNDFIDNHQIGYSTQAFCKIKNNDWNTTNKGNYWSDWRTPDADSDGIVDNPYTLDGAAAVKDFFPLTWPLRTIEYPPVITKNDLLIANVSMLYKIKYHADDPDTANVDLVWTMKTNASWLNFSTTQVLSGTPAKADIGSYWVNITVSDGFHIDFTNFTVVVIGNNFTYPPDITTLNVQTAYVGILYMVNYTANDPDTPNNQLIWGMTTNASWLSFSKNQVLSGTPTSSDLGPYWVKIIVSDGNNTDSTNFTLNVLAKKVYPPQITTQNVLIAYVGKLYLVNYSAIDQDTPQNKLTWTMNTNASTSWLNFSTAHKLSGTPSSLNIGTYWVSISVSDGLNKDHTNFTLTVIGQKPKQNFTRPKVEVTNIINNSHNVSVNTSKIVITFSKPMNRTSVESSLFISPSVNYTLSWNKNNTELQIIFNENLSYNETYFVSISTNAKDSEGNNLKNPFNLLFTTQIQIESTDDDPGDGEGESDNDSLFFNDSNFLGLIVGIIIIIIFTLIVTYMFFIKNQDKRKHDRYSEIDDYDGRYEYNGDEIIEINEYDDDLGHEDHDDEDYYDLEHEDDVEYDYDHDSEYEYENGEEYFEVDEYDPDQVIVDLKKEALGPDKPSDHAPSHRQMVGEFEKKYSKGDISKETLNLIKDSLRQKRI